jgi:hypothetical protein
MGYKGVGDRTKIHYSNKKLKWKPMCGSVGYRTSNKWPLVDCKKCLTRK